MALTPAVTILPLEPYADTLMLTRGILRSIVPPASQKAIVLRVSGGASILKELPRDAEGQVGTVVDLRRVREAR